VQLKNLVFPDRAKYKTEGVRAFLDSFKNGRALGAIKAAFSVRALRLLRDASAHSVVCGCACVGA
jgi:hypothetical protein